MNTARLGNDRVHVAVNAAVLPYRHGLSTPGGTERSPIATMLAIGWSRIFALGLICATTYGQAASSGPTFTVEHDHFVKDGKPTQLISGRYASDSSCDTLESACWNTSTACQAEACARNYRCVLLLGLSPAKRPRSQLIAVRGCSVHYHRIPAVYWRDRLLRVRSMGLNSIEVDLHYPAPMYFASPLHSV